MTEYLIESGLPYYGRTIRDLLRDPSISDRAKVLYALLDDYAHEGAAFPSRATLSASLGCSVDTLDRAVKELAEAGWITKQARYRSTGQQTSTLYTLSARGGRTHAAGGAAPMRPQEEESSKNLLPDEVGRESSARKKHNYSADFEEWWALYPKKTGKNAAQREYLKALKTDDPSCIIAGLRAQADSLREKCKPDPETGKIYCPDPRKWLYEGRWSDEITPLLTPLGRDDPFDPKRETRDQYLIRAGYAG